MPLWQLILSAAAFVAASIALGLSGLLATRGFVRRHASGTSHSHIFLTAVGFYSILLGFVTILVWQHTPRWTSR